jgi:hypothetical protein
MEVTMGKNQKSTTAKVMQLISFFLIIMILGYSSTVMAQQKSIILPKGTTVQKIGPGHFKFKLPNRQIVEVKNFNPKTGTIGYIGLIDPDPPTKPVVSGKMGTFVSSGKLTKEAASKLKPVEYIQIDDDVSWLPVTISYQPVVK